MTRATRGLESCRQSAERHHRRLLAHENRRDRCSLWPLGRSPVPGLARTAGTRASQQTAASILYLQLGQLDAITRTRFRQQDSGCHGEITNLRVLAPTKAVSWLLMSIPRPLKCAETWASNQGTSSVVDLPGLRVWVHSTPFGPGEAGGDVHYVSVCPSCIVSRIALADVSGHGRAVVSLGAKLRELMQTYLAALEQASLMRDLNEAVRVQLDGVHYATMVAVGFHDRRGLLVMTNAGHPPALWYRAFRDEWAWFEPQRAEGSLDIRGTPLGLLPNVSYDRMTVKPGPGDLIVLYSDGVSEATNQAGKELGRDDLMTLARTLDRDSAEGFGTQLVEAVNEFRGGRVPEDDETIIVVQRLSDQ
jgi:phosphoserine phosphatase RsbU/P